MLPRSLIGVIAAAGLAGGAAAACPAESAAPEFYPTASVLPENLLRVYVYFPRPMDAAVSAADLSLLDADGGEIPQAFLPTRYGLWSPDRRRLTVLLDPGRVKTGLAAHEALGRPIVAGNQYAIHVPGSLSDNKGCPLGNDARYAFTAGPADSEPPSPGEWRVDVPPAGSREALAVDLGSSHDHLSLAYRLRVVDDKGVRLPGTIDLAERESVWRFTPRAVWLPASYTIEIDPRLEDLAGNRPGTRFDRELDVPTQGWDRAIRFTPKSPDERGP